MGINQDKYNKSGFFLNGESPYGRTIFNVKDWVKGLDSSVEMKSFGLGLVESSEHFIPTAPPLRQTSVMHCSFSVFIIDTLFGKLGFLEFCIRHNLCGDRICYFLLNNSSIILSW